MCGILSNVSGRTLLCSIDRPELSRPVTWPRLNSPFHSASLVLTQSLSSTYNLSLSLSSHASSLLTTTNTSTIVEYMQTQLSVQFSAPSGTNTRNLATPCCPNIYIHIYLLYLCTWAFPICVRAISRILYREVNWSCMIYKQRQCINDCIWYKWLWYRNSNTFCVLISNQILPRTTWEKAYKLTEMSLGKLISLLIDFKICFDSGYSKLYAASNTENVFVKNVKVTLLIYIYISNVTV